MEAPRRSWRRRLALVAACAGAAVVPAAPVPAGADSEVPLTFSGRVEGTAVRYGLGAISTFADPGTAYTFAKVDSVVGIDGDRVLEMKAVGANLDPGTIVGAVIWAPGSSPLPPESGMHEARGFPFYSEAFHPTPEGQSKRTEKCFFNKEAQPSPECRAADAVMFSSGVVVPEEGVQVDGAPPLLSSTGFARAVGTDQGDLRIGETSSEAFVGPDEQGRLVSRHHATAREVVIAGTPVAATFSVSSEVVSTEEGATGTARCDAVITIAGQTLSSPEEINAALKAFGEASGHTIVFTPPTKPVVAPTASEPPGARASCQGARLEVVSRNTGVRLLYQLGDTMSVAAPLGVSLAADPSTGIDLPDGGGAIDVPTFTEDASFEQPFTAAPVTQTPAASSPPAQIAVDDGPATDQPVAAGPGPRYIRETLDALPIGAVTAGASIALGLGAWLLIAVVGSLARGGRLRLPGLG